MSQKSVFRLGKLICFGLFVFAGVTSQVHGDLANGDFEDPDTGPLPSAVFIDQSLVPHWQTTATDQTIEIWSNGFDGVTSYNGKQHAELNAEEASTLFQDVSGIASGFVVGFEFAHRARVGNDVMRLTITDLGIDNMEGGGNDTVLFSKEYTASASGWEFNTSLGEAPIVTLGNEIRFSYQAVSTGSGDPTVGNFIDAANFGVNVAVPEPSSFAILLGLAGLSMGLRFRKRQTTFNSFR